MKRKFLSILLTLAMALTLLPVSAMAEGASYDCEGGTDCHHKVAKINDDPRYDNVVAHFDTLEEAIRIGYMPPIPLTIKLLDDLTEDVVVPAGKDIYLDLNGHKLTNDSGHTITVEKGGKLNISDSVGTGVVDNTSHGKGAIVNSGEVTLNGGTFKRSAEKGTYSPYGNGGNSWYTIANYGTMEINTGVTVENAGGYSSMIRNGGDATADCNLTIRGGNFVGGVNTVKNDSFGVLTINGGNFSNTAQYVIMNWNKAEITAGTFQTLDTASAVLFTSAYDADANTIGKLSISGGEFKHASDTQEMIVDHYDASNSGTAAVTGGRFDADISKYIPSDYVQSADGTVEKLGETNAVAKVDDTYYKTLAEAVAAADNATVTLLKDVTEDVTIPADKTMTLDLNGKKLTNADGQDTITVALGASLTVTGSGTVDNVTHGKAAIYNNGTVILNGGSYTRSAEASTSIKDANGNSYYNILNHGTMTIGKNVSVTSRGSFSSLIANGYYNFSDTNPRSGYVSGTNQETPSLTINGGTFSGGINTIKNDDNATLTVNNGSFSNMTQAAIQNNHVATINGGTFDAKANHAIENRHFDGGHNTGSVTVTSGTFTGGLYTTTGATWSISGGTFSSDPSVYVVGNGSANIVKRAGSEGAYTYTVLAKSGLTSGVYLTNPSGALASNYYVSSTANGVWTVSYSAPSSGGGSSSSSRRYDVSAPSVKHGDVTVSPKTASKGDAVTITVKPDSGYELDTLTVKDASGSKIKVKDKGDGKYTFTMPASKVTVSAEFAEIETLDFADVSTDAYYYEAVKWAAKKGITGGIGDGNFNPNGSCTRAHIVTFLWRAAGSPEPKSTVSFADVPAGSYYAKAVAWAVENGITLGTGDGTFSPNATCTRAQSVTFLYRALGTAPTTVNGFTDVTADAFYADAVAWAVESGVTNGTSASTFSPNNGCTRAQIVTFLYRAYQGK